MQAIGLAKIPEEKYADLCSLQKSYITNGHQKYIFTSYSAFPYTSFISKPPSKIYLSKDLLQENDKLTKIRGYAIHVMTDSFRDTNATRK